MDGLGFGIGDGGTDGAGMTGAAAAAADRPPDDYVPLADDAPLWVFGYGSLMWNPGFPFMRRAPALLRGYHRRFCIYSHHYRGTPERPGLVLGLARGGACRGVAFEVAPDQARPTLAYLWRREMVSEVYRPALLGVETPEGRVPACTFVARPGHEQYCLLTEPEDMAALICQGHGLMGPNCEYLFNTVRHLDELGIADRALRRLAALVAQRQDETDAAQPHRL